jgi:hypothetical protein
MVYFMFQTGPRPPVATPKVSAVQQRAKKLAPTVVPKPMPQPVQQQQQQIPAPKAEPAQAFR